MSFDPTHPHKPAPLTTSLRVQNADFADLLLRARTALAELKGSCKFHPNPRLLLSPAIIREAVASSEIENINTTVAGALQGQLFPEAEQGQPDKEVLRYRDAVLWAFEQRPDTPISTRLIHGIARILIPDQPPGYRQQQNRIINERTGAVLYTPPLRTDIPALMGDWEKFVNGDMELDPVVKAAVAHYQFEAIHPFDDGNGRTGRILMVLQLVQDDLLPLPILFISGYINSRRADYYRLLRGVTADGAWTDYLRFMLDGFAHQAEQTTKMLERIGKLFSDMRAELKRDHKAIYTADLVQALFTYPIIIPARLSEKLDVHYITAGKHLQRLADAGLLKERRHGKYHLFMNYRLLDIMNK